MSRIEELKKLLDKHELTCQQKADIKSNLWDYTQLVDAVYEIHERLKAIEENLQYKKGMS